MKRLILTLAVCFLIQRPSYRSLLWSWRYPYSETEMSLFLWPLSF